jgi:adenine-specific DNA-methyltransferase
MSDLSGSYASSTSLEHRQRFAQFFTKAPIARFMAAWVLTPVVDELYDPAFGLGAFYEAARAINGTVAFAGCDLDASILEFWRHRSGAPNLRLSHEDYLRKWGLRHRAIVCNPPYMRFQRFLGRHQVFEAFKQHLGLTLSGYTNIASAFLVKSVSELTDRGRLAYIMPLEFLNTGYGAKVKQHMLRQGRIHAIIRLDCERDAFPDVTTSIGIILFEKSQGATDTQFCVVHQLEELGTLLHRPRGRIVCQEALQPEAKWLKYFEAEVTQVRAGSLTALSTYGAFSRGIATGANEFFVLRPSQAARIGLTEAEVLGCITKSSQVRTGLFSDRDWQNLISCDAQILLLNLNRELSPNAMEYIRQGEASGFHNRYLTRVRSPWYRTESRRPAPLWFGVFSRGGYKVVRNYTKALNLTCFHGFQPNLFGADLVDHLFLYLTSSAGRKILELNMRHYGNSLDKFEPNDLNNALVPTLDWFHSISPQQVAGEVERVAKYGPMSSRMEAIFARLTEPVGIGSANSSQAGINALAAEESFRTDAAKPRH